MPDVPFIIAGRTFQSRLIVGTGKYPSMPIMVKAHAASGADMVTVAVRRVNLTDRSQESLLDYLDQEQLFILPNTAGCYTAEEAIRTARLGREAGLSNWVKLEVIGDKDTLFPDNEALLQATRTLVKEGFIVLPYTNDDPVVCRKLEEAGASAVMPLGAPIGSGLGIQNINNIRIIRESAHVPVIVDAGVGTAEFSAVADMPADSSVRLMYARLLVQQNETKLAYYTLQDINDYAQPSIELLGYRASLAQKLGLLDDALQDYAQLVLLDSQNAKWWLGQAVVADKQGVTALALSSYREALSLRQLEDGIEQFIRQHQ